MDNPEGEFGTGYLLNMFRFNKMRSLHMPPTSNFDEVWRLQRSFPGLFVNVVITTGLSLSASS